MKLSLNIRAWCAVLLTIAVVAVTTCCTPEPRHSALVPNMTVPNTDIIKNVVVTANVAQGLAAKFREDAEVGSCLYGKMEGDTLIVDSFMTPPQVATDSTVEFECAAGPSFVGIVHTHPLQRTFVIDMETNAVLAWPCWPSLLDEENWRRPDMLLQGVMCGNGIVFLELRDGRFWFARWR